MLAGRLEGGIDLVTPDGNGTYPLTIEEAKNLQATLGLAIADVEDNCLYERDSLLKR